MTSSGDNQNISCSISPLGGKGAGIIGGAGYTGGELVRLLLNHTRVNIRFVHSKSSEGKYLHEVHADLLGETDLKFTGELQLDVDVLFLCLGHGESKKFLDENAIPAGVKIIDLANDFRLEKDAQQGDRHFIYGLPELNKEEITKAKNIANPGCFATCIQLGLLPLAKAGLLKDVYTTGITGSTGAGQSLSPTSHFSWRENNIQSYKTLNHQHVPEIMQSLNAVKPVNQSTYQPINFIPWRGDFTRGIFVSSQLHCLLSIEELNVLYKDFYKDAAFVHISHSPLFLKQVVNTNKCIIQVEKVGEMVVVHSVIDNLLKGAVGQAVQNMNLMFGLDEKAGLNLKPSAF